jgi:hypothetical protein
MCNLKALEIGAGEFGITTLIGFGHRGWGYCKIAIDLQLMLARDLKILVLICLMKIRCL